MRTAFAGLTGKVLKMGQGGGGGISKPAAQGVDILVKRLSAQVHTSQP